jgi:hypothetical protein
MFFENLEALLVLLQVTRLWHRQTCVLMFGVGGQALRVSEKELMGPV